MHLTLTRDWTLTAAPRPPAAILVVLVGLLALACATQPLPTPTASPSPRPTDTAQPSATPAPPRHSLDNELDLAGLRHDSRDLLYRTPGGAVPAGTPVTLRLRTFHDDAATVRLRYYSVDAARESLLAMTRVADGVSCYEAALVDDTCDFWEVTLPDGQPDNLWYRFIVGDGSATGYYADDTAALDGGPGKATADVVDLSYSLTVYEPDFKTPDWPAGAVMYQVFPDRFRDGNGANNPHTGDVRYDEPVLALDWGTLPEGFCRGYVDAAATCPWRYDASPPDWSPTIEGPQNRDYMGGDLRGVIDKLDYLQALGIGVIYLNPIFDSASNHGYDTQDYTTIDPYLGTQADFAELVSAARERGMRVVLDGVFNHMSSDSRFFDRYDHYETLGACESAESAWRSWFTFQLVPGGSTGPCAAPGAPNRMSYQGWAGFDTIPIVNKTRPEVQDYFLAGSQSITRLWLSAGIGGWRMDVSGDPSFPDGYWETFRQVVKAANGDALTISETWQKDSVLLRALRGDRFDTTMNYRLRDAVLGLLTPDSFDAKGFADSGRAIEPTQFASRLLAIQEDYPPPAYDALMNLLDSHDTERALWSLTPGLSTQSAREADLANLDEGKRRLRLAALIQFTVPGMPSVYYGDEVGVTGDDDPDNRRSYPWADQGGSPDEALLDYYRTLSAMRRDLPALHGGDLQVLLADDTAGVVAIGRRSDDQRAVIAVNRSTAPQSVVIPTAGFVPDGTVFASVLDTSGRPVTPITASLGAIRVDLQPLAGLVLASAPGADLRPPDQPTDLAVEREGDAQLTLTWTAASGAVGYNLYRSPVSGGGWVRVNDIPLSSTTFTDTGLPNARQLYYAVSALDAAGNESGLATGASGMPHLEIAQAALTGPQTLSHTISATTPTAPLSGSLILTAPATAGDTTSVLAQVGFGPLGSSPGGNADWTWTDARLVGDGSLRFEANLLPDRVGTFDYVARFSTTRGRDWVYADLDGIFGDQPANPGRLTVNASSDATPPGPPTNVSVISASVLGVDLEWLAPAADASLHGYEIGRADAPAGPFRTIAIVTTTQFHDPDVSDESPIYYVVRALDSSFNRSPDSAVVEAKPGPRPVSVTFNVTIPPPVGPAAGRTVYIAGTLDQLADGLPAWDPAGVAMTRLDDTHWTITLDGTEGLNLDYKYVLGTWDYVEKDQECGEIPNRRLTLAYGIDGQQTVDDVVPNWRGVGGCPA